MRHMNRTMLLLFLVALFATAVPITVTATMTATPRPTLFPSPTPPRLATIPPTISALAPNPSATYGYQQPQDVFISIGQTVTGSLPANSYDPVRYIFNGQGGQVISLSSSTDNRSTLNFYVQDVNGYSINQLTSTGNNVSFILPYTGQFIIFVGAIGYQVDYTLSLTEATPRSIAYGQTIEDSLPSEGGLVKLYSFSAEQGERIFINVESLSPHFSPGLALVQIESNTILNSIYPYGGSAQRTWQVQLPLFIIPADGTYTIVVFGNYMPETSPDYAVSVQEIIPIPVQYGETVEGEFTADTSRVFYSFDGSYADTIDLTLIGDDNLDSMMTVFTALGEQLTFDDDSGAGLSSEISNLYLYQTGEFVVLVQPFSRRVEGTFAFEIDRTEGSTLEDGPQTVILDKFPVRTLTFEARAGEEIRLIVTFEDGFTPVINVYQRENQLLNLNPIDLERISVDFTVPRSGVVTVQIERVSYGGLSGAVEVSIERLNTGE